MIKDFNELTDYMADKLQVTGVIDARGVELRLVRKVYWDGMAGSWGTERKGNSTLSTPGRDLHYPLNLMNAVEVLYDDKQADISDSGTTE